MSFDRISNFVFDEGGFIMEIFSEIFLYVALFIVGMTIIFIVRAIIKSAREQPKPWWENLQDKIDEKKDE